MKTGFSAGKDDTEPKLFLEIRTDQIEKYCQKLEEDEPD